MTFPIQLPNKIVEARFLADKVLKSKFERSYAKYLLKKNGHKCSRFYIYFWKIFGFLTFQIS